MQARVVAVVKDLFFVARIRETARMVGTPLVFARTPQELTAALAEPAGLVIVDLTARDLDEGVDLVGGEPRAVVLAHGLHHVVDQPLDLGGADRLERDRLRFLTKHRVPETRHLQNRHDAQNCSMPVMH